MTNCQNSYLIIRAVAGQCLLDTLCKVMTILWVLKSNVFECIFASGCMSLGKQYRHTDRQTDISIDINVSGSPFVKKDFLSSKLFHSHVQYVFHESAKYQNLSTNS